MNTRRRIKYIHEGKYGAEVDVDLIEDDTEWSPYLTVEDAEKLDDVRAALAHGDIEEAAKKARIYTLHPVAPLQGSGYPVGLQEHCAQEGKARAIKMIACERKRPHNKRG